MEATKICARCKNEKLVSDFSKNSANKDGLSFYCRVCEREKTKEYRQRDSVGFRYSSYKTHSKQREIVFSLTNREFANIVDKSCHYCGLPSDSHMGIDRIHNQTAYLVENCVSCCWNCNRSKYTRSAFQYKGWLGTVYDWFVVGNSSLTVERQTEWVLLNQSYESYLFNAKKHHRVFDIDFKSFCRLSSTSCHYCGGFGPKGFNGIDRLNSMLHYSKRNCVPACKWCNHAKYDMSIREFKAFVTRAYIFQKGLDKSKAS